MIGFILTIFKVAKEKPSSTTCCFFTLQEYPIETVSPKDREDFLNLEQEMLEKMLSVFPSRSIVHHFSRMAHQTTCQQY